MIKIDFFMIIFLKIKIIVILYVKYMFKKEKNFNFIREVVAAERFNVCLYIWCKNDESVKQ